MAEYSHTSTHHRLHVADNNGVRTLRFERNQQSSMRLDDTFATDIEYVGYLHLTRAVVPDPARALVIGLGGGMFVKQLWRDHPALIIDAVELDSEVVAIAREFFALPDDPRINVHVGDGREWLEASGASYDIIVVDAYDDDRIPVALTTEGFMHSAVTHLNPGGVIAYNIIGAISGSKSKPLRSLYRTAANVWRTVWLFTVDAIDPGGPRPENVVLLASDASLPDEELCARIADRVGGRVSVPDFERFGEHLYRGPIRTGDVPILTDPPARASRHTSS
ncbi:MAG: fused MFS/spermidine synthase [Coriobacteriia bacterium]|nr:fused MFS/spermidine synthase [Coriobacteriia bacterium]